MGFNNPTIQQFKDQFVRDFPYGTDPVTSILDADIQNAFVYAGINFSQNLWADQPSYTLGFNLLSAHYLVLNIRQSSQGISGQYNFLQNSKGAGGVSEGFSIPQRILDNPEFAMLTKTNYGAQYLMLIIPQLSGQVFNAFGSTRP